MNSEQTVQYAVLSNNNQNPQYYLDFPYYIVGPIERNDRNRSLKKKISEPEAVLAKYK